MKKKFLVIYNPKAGQKKKLLNPTTPKSRLRTIKNLFLKYELEADFVKTTKKIPTIEIAKKAVKSGYQTVVVAGGDGTVGEVANGLVHSNVSLGILPLGSYMNVAKMLGIPSDLELAVAMIKINRLRKVDMGVVHSLSGKKLSQPYYYIENASIGLEAKLQKRIVQLEQGDMKALARIFKDVFRTYEGKVTLKIGKKISIEKANLITVSNAPMSGPNVVWAPDSKLNDHVLSINLFPLEQWDLVKHVSSMLWNGKSTHRSVKKITAKEVTISTEQARSVHADGRLFGKTPVKFSIAPAALTVIAGFPDTREVNSLNKHKTKASSKKR